MMMLRYGYGDCGYDGGYGYIDSDYNVDDDVDSMTMMMMPLMSVVMVICGL